MTSYTPEQIAQQALILRGAAIAAGRQGHTHWQECMDRAADALEAMAAERGKIFAPEPHHEVKCHIHGVVTTWGALDEIQKLAVEDGIDTVEDSRCLLLPREDAPPPPKEEVKV